jgi:phosphoribosyl 1,2-cyclic phosphodiesterase
VLASGSSGNSALVATGKTRLLIDAGLGLRDLTKRLAAIGECPEALDAVLITHEHCDHVSGLLRLLRKLEFKIPVYVTHLTAPQIDWEDSTPRREVFQSGMEFTIGDITVQSFGIPHDAIDPVGFYFKAEGIKIAIATDLGYIPDSIKCHLRRARVLLLESNHDVEMLKVGPYPWMIKQRVMGRRGHLSNDVVCEFLSSLEFDSATGTLILGHLSEQNNHPEIVRMGAMQALDGRGVDTQLVIAEHNRATEVFQF